MSEASKSLSDYPPLPEMLATFAEDWGPVVKVGFTADQMRAYVAADRASQASAQPPTDDPTSIERATMLMGWALEFRGAPVEEFQDAYKRLWGAIELALRQAAQPPVQQKGEGRADFERYAAQMGFTDFERSPDHDGYRNPWLESPWNFWNASRAALASTPHSAPEAQAMKTSYQPSKHIDWSHLFKPQMSSDGGKDIPLAPPSIHLMDRIESYEFECLAGNLRNCQDWHALRAALQQPVSGK